jgi:hypothetical protein
VDIRLTKCILWIGFIRRNNLFEFEKKGTVQLTRWLCKNHWSVTTTISWWMSIALQTILTSTHVKIIEAWPPTFHGDCPSHCRQYWHQHMSKSLKSDHQHFMMNVLHIADNTDITRQHHWSLTTNASWWMSVTL